MIRCLRLFLTGDFFPDLRQLRRGCGAPAPLPPRKVRKPATRKPQVKAKRSKARKLPAQKRTLVKTEARTALPKRVPAQ